MPLNKLMALCRSVAASFVMTLAISVYFVGLLFVFSEMVGHVKRFALELLRDL